MTTAPSKPTRKIRTTAHTPRPLPVWLQVGVVVLLLVQGVQTVAHWYFASAAPPVVQAAPPEYYYTRDHLGSVREMVNSSGSIVARYSYDPYGRTTLVSGNNLATFQYTGDYAHQASGLSLAIFRAYDPNTGRWLSRDPIAERGGLNLYE